MRKAIWTLAVDNYAPEITALTFPLMKLYARKCRADFNVITERKFPGWPPVYEKLQIYELGRDYEFNHFIDADAVVHPEMWPVSDLLPRDTVCHNGNDLAPNRWILDRFFRRDGRMISSCNWFTAAWDWCLELWKPLDDLTLEEAIQNISPTPMERAPYILRCPGCGNTSPAWSASPTWDNCPGCGKARTWAAKHPIETSHLIDDYVLSRNIAKYGLKFTNVQRIQEQFNDHGNYMWHEYTLPTAQKVASIKAVLHNWGLDYMNLDAPYEVK
jgi:hypothetical protein